MTTTTTTDARVRVYYKLTLWALRLRWAKKREIGHLIKRIFLFGKPTTFNMHVMQKQLSESFSSKTS